MYVHKFLNGTKTQLLVHGEVFQDSGEIVVFIPGNPGIPEFYEEFALELHNNTDLPICVVGYGGQDSTSPENQHLFSLQGQLQHKFDFINNFINRGHKIHFVGHSLGAWFVLELLHGNNNLINKVSSVHLLFPTLQRLTETENAKFVQNVYRKFHLIIMLILHAIQLIPNAMQKCIIRIWLKLNSMPSHYVDRILLYLKPRVQKQQLLLAYEAIDTINELNRDVIDQIKELTTIIYAAGDGWVPVERIKDLTVFEPQLKLVKVNALHAFVKESSELIANIVAESIKHKQKCM